MKIRVRGSPGGGKREGGNRPGSGRGGRMTGSDEKGGDGREVSHQGTGGRLPPKQPQKEKRYQKSDAT